MSKVEKIICSLMQKYWELEIIVEVAQCLRGKWFISQVSTKDMKIVGTIVVGRISFLKKSLVQANSLKEI
jgi:hypothetical protein